MRKLIKIIEETTAQDIWSGLLLPALIFFLFYGTGCSSVPMVTITEQEHLDLQRKVRVLERELSDTKADYQAEREEQLKAREYLRKVEHPLTLREEQERFASKRNGEPVPYSYTKREQEETDADVLAIRQAAQDWCAKNPGCEPLQ